MILEQEDFLATVLPGSPTCRWGARPDSRRPRPQVQAAKFKISRLLWIYLQATVEQPDSPSLLPCTLTIDRCHRRGKSNFVPELETQRPVPKHGGLCHHRSQQTRWGREPPQAPSVTQVVRMSKPQACTSKRPGQTAPPAWDPHQRRQEPAATQKSK